VILLTGGTGLLGRHIIAECRAAGIPVLALARTTAAEHSLRQLGAEPMIGAVEDPAVWDRVGGVSAIVHGAAVIASREGWPRYQEVNVVATRLAARRAAALGVPLVHLSSIAVYAPGTDAEPPGTVTEDWPIGSTTAGPFYARSKRLAEQEVWQAAGDGLRVIVLRPCVVYGEGDRLFLPNVIARAEQLGALPMVGTGRRPLTLVQARNVAQAVRLAFQSTAGWGGVYNVTNDDEISGDDFVLAVSEGLERPIRAVHLPAGLTLGLAGLVDAARRLWGPAFPEFRAAARFLHGGNPYASARARQLLGWRPDIRHRIALPLAVRAVWNEVRGRLGGRPR